MSDSYQPHNPFCDRQAGREARQLNSEQIDQAGNAVVFFGLNQKVVSPGRVIFGLMPENDGCNEPSGSSGQ